MQALGSSWQLVTQFSVTKLRSVVQHDTFIRKQLEIEKRIKQWWLTTDGGRLALRVRYGTRLLELSKIKYAFEFASEKALVPTLELMKSAVLSGELDAAIEPHLQRCEQASGNSYKRGPAIPRIELTPLIQCCSFKPAKRQGLDCH